MLNHYSTTKRKIFLAASKLFSQKCYADVGIREIAIEAGVKVPTVYNHYPSKEAILDDLLQFFMDRISADYNSAEMLDIGKEDPLASFKKILFTFDATESELMRQLMRIVFNEQYRSPLAAKILYDVMLRGGKTIDYAFLSRLKNKGMIQCEDIDSLAEVFTRVAVTFAMQYVRDDEMEQRPDYENVMMRLLKLILNDSSPQEQDKFQDDGQAWTNHGLQNTLQYCNIWNDDAEQLL